MKAKDVLDEEWLKITDLENAFDVRQRQDGAYLYNLNETVYLDVDPDRLSEFVCDSRMHWPLISYRIYGTTRLAWLLAKLNKVRPEDMFRAKEPSETVAYLDKDSVQEVVRSVNGYS